MSGTSEQGLFQALDELFGEGAVERLGTKTVQSLQKVWEAARLFERNSKVQSESTTLIRRDLASKIQIVASKSNSGQMRSQVLYQGRPLGSVYSLLATETTPAIHKLKLLQDPEYNRNYSSLDDLCTGVLEYVWANYTRLQRFDW